MPDGPRSPMTAHEQDALMPRSAPAPRAPGRGPEERDLAMLEGQVHALEHEIHDARGAAQRARGGLGSLRGSEREPQARSPRGELVRLRDGAEIMIRTMEPEDAAELRAGFERLSAVSRYRRFLTEIEHLTPYQLDYLTRVDHVDHEALVAFAVTTGQGVATARFVRDRGEHATAEVAVVVADEWQGRGVGTALLERVAARARAAGIDCFTARMIVGNEPARRVLARLGDIAGERQDAGSIELKLRLR
jgi:RimJ/RimL family protein N-acetyltransferase